MNAPISKPIPNPVSVRRRLLRWYDRHGRDLPWRYKNGETPDPYRVWLSEIMLAQTTVAAVKGYFDDFINRWPTVDALARADLEAVLHAWQGLGYYARARNLHKCARIVAGDLGGRFPDTEPALKKLPGIGDYTAAAIAAIGFHKKATPVDANIERVTARLFALADALPKGKARIGEHASMLTPNARPGDFAQAMMDLGSGVCTPKAPDCGACPLKPECMAARRGDPDRYPAKAAKVRRPVRHGMVFWAVRDDGRVMLRKRPERGLLGGMTEIPSTDWREQTWSLAEASRQAPVKGRWRRLDGVVRHTFTHFHLELTVLTAVIKTGNPKGALWCAPSGFSEHALPTLMKKVARFVAGYSS